MQTQRPPECAPGIPVRGPRLLLRPAEVDEEWRAMVAADSMTIAELPAEAGFKARLRRSGRLVAGPAGHWPAR